MVTGEEWEETQRVTQALHEPGAGDYAAIFRAHDSELLS